MTSLQLPYDIKFMTLLRFLYGISLQNGIIKKYLYDITVSIILHFFSI